MKYKVIKKEKGKISNTTREVLSCNKLCISPKDKIFEGVVGSIDDKKNTIRMSRNMVFYMTTIFSKTKEGFQVIKEMFKRIKKAKSMEDLKLIAEYMYSSYIRIINITFDDKKHAKDKQEALARVSIYQKYLSENLDSIISIMVKRVVYIYYHHMVKSLNPEQFKLIFSYKDEKNYEEMKKVIGDIDEVLENSDEYDNGMNEFTNKMLSDIIDVVFDAKQRHLCWENCVNANPLICPKIRESLDIGIEQYDFITDGYEVITMDGEVEKYVVTGCTKYVRSKSKY